MTDDGISRAAVNAELPRDPNAPWRARQIITHAFAPWLDSDQLYRAKLLASELVANAVVHGAGVITLRGRRDPGRLLIEVIDEGAGFTPSPGRPSLDQVRQRGLMIVDAEASRWGIHEGSARVWFELDMPSRSAHSRSDGAGREAQRTSSGLSTHTGGRSGMLGGDASQRLGTWKERAALDFGRAQPAPPSQPEPVCAESGPGGDVIEDRGHRGGESRFGRLTCTADSGAAARSPALPARRSRQSTETRTGVTDS